MSQRKGGGRKSGSYQKIWETMSGKGDINSTLPPLFTLNPSVSSPVLEISHKELSTQHLYQNLLGVLVDVQILGSYSR